MTHVLVTDFIHCSKEHQILILATNAVLRKKKKKKKKTVMCLAISA